MEINKKFIYHLNRVYPPWKKNLWMFFPGASYEMLEDPPTSMLALLSKAFGYQVSDEKSELEKLKEALQEKLQEMLSPPDSKDSENSDEGSEEKGNSSGSGEDGSSEEKGESGGGEGDSSEGEGDSTTGDSEGEGGKAGSGEGGTIQSMQYEIQMLEEALGNPARGEATSNINLPPGDATYYYARGAHDRALSRKIEPKVDFHLSTLFKKILVAETRDRLRFGTEEGELDNNRLVGAATGERDVFGQWHIGKRRKTAVVIALDHSGSMGIGMDVQQAIAAVNIVSALDKVNIPVEIITFGNSNHFIRLFDDKSDWLPPAGWSSQEHPQLSFSYATKRLIQRRETRKILLLLSDGSVWPEYTQKYVEEADRHKIERYLFCIGFKPREHVRKSWLSCYTNVVSSEDGDGDLESNLYRYMEELLKEKHLRNDN